MKKVKDGSNEMDNTNPEMKYNLSHQHKDLIGMGIIKIILLTLFPFIIYFGISNTFLLSLFFKFLLFLIVFALLEPIIICMGISDIIQGRKKIKLEIDGSHIRKYEDEKLKIDISVDELEKITYTYPDTLEWRTIVFRLLNKKKIKLNISEKKEFPKIEEFFKFLVSYSKNYHISFEENKIKSRAIVFGF